MVFHFLWHIFCLMSCLSLAFNVGVRPKRSLSEFCQVLNCVVPSEEISDEDSVWSFSTELKCLQYYGYGCYCGLGGEGEPMDEIDRCCQVHDHCYGIVAEQLHCPEPKEDEYSYKCIVAKNQTLNNNKMKYIPTCDTKANNFCSERTCQCDVEMAMCVSKYPYPEDPPVCTTTSTPTHATTTILHTTPQVASTRQRENKGNIFRSLIIVIIFFLAICLV